MQIMIDEKAHCQSREKQPDELGQLLLERWRSQQVTGLEVLRDITRHADRNADYRPDRHGGDHPADFGDAEVQQDQTGDQ